MFGRLRRLREARAAERARNEILRQQLADVQHECESWRWAAKEAMGSHDDLVVRRTRERDDAVKALRATALDLAKSRARAARYRKAWQSARRRAGSHRSEAAAQAVVIERLTGQLFDAIGYDTAQRDRLDMPAAEVTS
jgi:hypothetical protein